MPAGVSSSSHISLRQSLRTLENAQSEVPSTPWSEQGSLLFHSNQSSYARNTDPTFSHQCQVRFHMLRQKLHLLNSLAALLNQELPVHVRLLVSQYSASIRVLMVLPSLSVTMCNKLRARRSALRQEPGIGPGPRVPLVHHPSAFPFIYQQPDSVLNDAHPVYVLPW